MNYSFIGELNMNFDCDNDHLDCLKEDIATGIISATYDLTGATNITCKINKITKERETFMKTQTFSFTIDDPALLTRIESINERLKKINSTWDETRLIQTISEMFPHTLNMLLLMLETHAAELEKKKKDS